MSHTRKKHKTHHQSTAIAAIVTASHSFEIERLQEEKSALAISNSKLVMQNHLLEAQLKDSKKNKETLQVQLESAKITIQSYELSKNMDARNLDTSSRLTTLLQENKKLLEQSIQNLTASNIVVSHQLEESKAKNSRVQTENEKLVTEKNQLSLGLQQSQQSFEELRAAYNLLAAENNRIVLEKNELADRLKKLQDVKCPKPVKPGLFQPSFSVGVTPAIIPPKSAFTPVKK
jgi:chromosome segregation ATPase